MEPLSDAIGDDGIFSVNNIGAALYLDSERMDIYWVAGSEWIFIFPA